MLSSLLSNEPLRQGEYQNVKLPLDIWFQIACVTDHSTTTNLLKVSKGMLSLLAKVLDFRAHKMDTIYTKYRDLFSNESPNHRYLTLSLSESYIMSNRFWNHHIIRRLVKSSEFINYMAIKTDRLSYYLYKDIKVTSLEIIPERHLRSFEEAYVYNKRFKWDLYYEGHERFSFSFDSDALLRNPSTPWDILKGYKPQSKKWLDTIAHHPNAPFEEAKRVTWGKVDSMIKVCKTRAITLEYLEETLRLMKEDQKLMSLRIVDPSLLPTSIIIKKLKKPLKLLLGLDLECIGHLPSVPLKPYAKYLHADIPLSSLSKMLRKRPLTLEELEWLWSLRYNYNYNYENYFWVNVSLNRSFKYHDVLNTIHYEWDLSSLACNPSITLSEWLLIHKVKGGY